MVDIENEFFKSDFNYDRAFGVEYDLPYNYEFYIQPNELSNYNTINKKLFQLYDNFLYIYSRCSFLNYDIPTYYKGYIGVENSQLGIYENTQNSQKFNLGGYGDIDNSKNATICKKDNFYYLFINCLSSINVLRYDENNNICQICQNVITMVDPISGDLTFKKISNIKSYKNKYLFVSDEQLNLLLRYDLETYFSKENIYKDFSQPFGSKLFLNKILGGEGDRYDKTKFKNLKNFTIYEDLILIEDSENKILKLYDIDFNFLTYSTFFKLYNNGVSFENFLFKNLNEIYGITKNGYYIFNLELENYKLSLNSFQSLSSFINENEKIIDLNFCGYENDIIYILTDKSFIKKWEYEKERIIGLKKTSYFGSNYRFKWFISENKNENSDNIQIFFNNINSNGILLYDDEYDIISNLKNKNFNIFSKEEIFIKKNEYNQSWVYEKNLKKLLKNMEILKNNIYYNLISEKSEDGKIITNIKKIYNKKLLDDGVFYYNNNFLKIGINENFQTSVINREFEKIYNLQKKLLSFVLSDNFLKYNLIDLSVVGFIDNIRFIRFDCDPIYKFNVES